MDDDIEIEIIHTGAGELHPSGWLVRVAGEVSVVAPIEDAVRIALRVARDVMRTSGSPVGIRLIDSRGSVELARFGVVPWAEHAACAASPERV